LLSWRNRARLKVRSIYFLLAKIFERPSLTRQPPRVGEHNAEILREAGFSPAEIAALSAEQVIVQAA